MEMESDEWLAGWREIGNYLGKSAKTAQRCAKKRDCPSTEIPGGADGETQSMIDAFILRDSTKNSITIRSGRTRASRLRLRMNTR